MYRLFTKRILDILVAVVAILLLMPLLIIVSAVLYLQNNGKPFFIQNRPGKNQIPFNIIKFRTMSEKKDKKGKLLPDNERITSTGKILRDFSIDELPQLINILKGEMSLVGPRPLLFKYIPLYNETQLKRHHVRPGITGLAQVNGRNNITWTKKFELDSLYVDNISFSNDLKIITQTFFKVLNKEGVNQTETRPMEPFNGYN